MCYAIEVIDTRQDQRKGGKVVQHIRADGKGEERFERMLERYGHREGYVVQGLNRAGDIVIDNQGPGGAIRRLRSNPAKRRQAVRSASSSAVRQHLRAAGREMTGAGRALVATSSERLAEMRRRAARKAASTSKLAARKAVSAGKSAAGKAKALAARGWQNVLAIRSNPAATGGVKITINWRNDDALRALWSWQTRVGLGPKFGSLPIMYYQMDHVDVTEYLEAQGATHARLHAGQIEIRKPGSAWVAIGSVAQVKRAATAYGKTKRSGLLSNPSSGAKQRLRGTRKFAKSADLHSYYTGAAERRRKAAAREAGWARKTGIGAGRHRDYLKLGRSDLQVAAGLRPALPNPRAKAPAGHVLLTKAFALRLMDWHGGGGSGVYATASTAYAGRPVQVASVSRAIGELERDLLHPTNTAKDKRDLQALIATLRKAVPVSNPAREAKRNPVRWPIRSPAIASLRKLGLSKEQAEKVKAAAAAGKGRTALKIADEGMNGHGVESLYPEYPNIYYVNMGDTYKQTLIWNTEGSIYIGAWGDYVERHSR